MKFYDVHISKKPINNPKPIIIKSKIHWVNLRTGEMVQCYPINSRRAALRYFRNEGDWNIKARELVKYVRD